MRTAYPRGWNLRQGGTAAFCSLALLSLTGCMPPIEIKGAGAARMVTYELNRDTQVWTKTDCKIRTAINQTDSSSEGVCFKETLKTPPTGLDVGK